MAVLTGLLLTLGALPYFGFVIFIIRGLFKPVNISSTKHFPRVAVIVAARNEAVNLPGLLADLATQQYQGELECIIADDRSNDDTWTILHKFCKAHTGFTAVRITQESTEMTGKKNALTQCIKRTSADILLETDADCHVGPEWVDGMVAQFDQQTGIVIGLSTVRGRGVFAIFQALDFMGIMMANAGMMSYGKSWSGSGQNLAFKRRLFTAIGGFAGADQTVGDDFYLVQKISRLAGVTARFSWQSESFVTTAASETLAEFYHQRVRWAADTRGLQKRDPLFFGFLVSAFILNTGILISAFSFNLGLLLVLILGVKFCLELTVCSIGFSRIKRIRDLWVFILWFLLQPVYIPIMGISGLFGSVRWK